MCKWLTILARKDNYIWGLLEAEGALIVDPSDAEPVISRLEALGANLEVILLTHHHHDHCGGVGKLQQRYPDVVVYQSQQTEHPEEGAILLQGGERLNWHSLPIEVLALPGHTRDHLGFYLPSWQGQGALFCGDTLFSAGCGRVFDGTIDDLFASLNLIATLPPQTKLFPAHEYSADNIEFALKVEPQNAALLRRKRAVLALREQHLPTLPISLAAELTYNPFLRCSVLGLQQQVSALFALENPTPLQVFRTLRQWKQGDIAPKEA